MSTIEHMACCLQVDAVKRNCIKVLPHTLVIHLKRFEFDFEAMSRWKIKSRCADRPLPVTCQHPTAHQRLCSYSLSPGLPMRILKGC